MRSYIDNLLYLGTTESKVMYLTIEIYELLHRHNCTYDETAEILELTQAELDAHRIELEYINPGDYANYNKGYDCGKNKIFKLNHID